MSYKCTQCGLVSEAAGNCPTCNIPLVEVVEEVKAEEVKVEGAAEEVVAESAPETPEPPKAE